MKKTILFSTLAALTMAGLPSTFAASIEDCMPVVGKTLGDLFGTPLPGGTMNNTPLKGAGFEGWARTGSTLIVFKPTYTVTTPSMTTLGGERCHYKIMDGATHKGTLDLIPPAPVAAPVEEPAPVVATDPALEPVPAASEPVSTDTAGATQ